MARARIGLRWLSLGFLLVTIAKVFLYDLGELRDLYRVLSLVGARYFAAPRLGAVPTLRVPLGARGIAIGVTAACGRGSEPEVRFQLSRGTSMILLFALLLAQVEPTAQLSAIEPTTIILVRHAREDGRQPQRSGPQPRRSGARRRARRSAVAPESGARSSCPTRSARERPASRPRRSHNLTEIAIPVEGGARTT
jgi:hypothetical protein